MFRIATLALAGSILFSTIACICGQETATPNFSADEAAVRQVTKTLVEEFNAGKVDKIVELFGQDAEIIDDAGNVYTGPAEITDVLTRFFKTFPGAASQMTADSVSLIGPDLAIEEGQRVVTTEDGQASAETRYTLVMTKREGMWKIASAREEEADVPPRPHDRLKPLAWLVGDWVDEGADAVVGISCRWSDDQNFLLVEFNAKVEGKPALKSNQRIGWDPLTQKIKSWVFDSDGGYGEGLWSQVDDRWVVKSNAVLPDGRIGSATLMIEPRDQNSYVMKGFDRFRGDEAEPDFEITIVRGPPSPAK